MIFLTTRDLAEDFVGITEKFGDRCGGGWNSKYAVKEGAGGFRSRSARRTTSRFVCTLCSFREHEKVGFNFRGVGPSSAFLTGGKRRLDLCANQVAAAASKVRRLKRQRLCPLR